MGMSDLRKSEASRCDERSKNPGKWIPTNAKPKLDIRNKSYNVFSQSVAPKHPTGETAASPKGRSGSLRRTNSLPTSPRPTPLNDLFLVDNEDDFDPRALAEAAAAAEAASAAQNFTRPMSKLTTERASALNREKAGPSSTKPSSVRDYGNNGSSGFDVLFGEEIAEEDVEECMLLATVYSQQKQASQNDPAVGNTSLSQAYNIFSKGAAACAHSSILETRKDVFRRPLPSLPSTVPTHQARMTTAKNEFKPGSSSIKNEVNASSKFPQPPYGNNLRQSHESRYVQGTLSARSHSTTASSKTSSYNPQAEAEVRRLSLEQERIVSENKRLKEMVRTKEGEAAILRSQLKKTQADMMQQKTTNAQTVAASQQHYGERVRELEKEIERIKIKLQFQEAETNTARERARMLGASQRVKLVDPHVDCAGPCTPTPPTPQRNAQKKHVSSFLNRSTFETALSQRKPPTKRPRLSEDPCDAPILQDSANAKPSAEQDVVKPVLKEEGKCSETIDKSFLWIINPVTRSAGQTLSERLAGRQLVPVVTSEKDFTISCNKVIGDWDAVPAVSLLNLNPGQSKKKRRTIDEEQRPKLARCAENLRQLMLWQEPTLDSAAAETLILEIAEECCGLVHYYMITLRDEEETLSIKKLAERDQALLEHGSSFAPLSQEFDILDDKQWYPEECGVEVRLALGILSELANISQFAANVLTGAVEQHQRTLRHHRFTKLLDFQSEIMTAGRNDSQISGTKNDAGQPMETEEHDRFWFFQVLLVLCSTIEKQKLTLAQNGVLAGAVTIIQNCARRGAITRDSRSLVLSIIREVVLCRPAHTVLLLLVELLKYLSNCEEIMNGLCCHCDKEDCYVNPSDGLCYFTRDACLLQLLCVQIQSCTGVHRWLLADAVVRWLLAVLGQSWSAPYWILPTYSDSGKHEQSPVHTLCCLKLMSTLIFLLYDTFHILHKSIEKQGEMSESTTSMTIASQEELEPDDVPLSALKCIMQKSILLLHGLFTNGMTSYLGRVEGLYESLIRGLYEVRDHLQLSSVDESTLKKLVSLEEQVMAVPDNSASSLNKELAELDWEQVIRNMKFDC